MKAKNIRAANGVEVGRANKPLIARVRFGAKFKRSHCLKSFVKCVSFD